ncbi:MAG TPA: ABC transporter ATP-binding protein [Ktedonobacterales bacterium]|nr:ABC transporter ATP-binding protein [Ktedonobacterales bacterium]
MPAIECYELTKAYDRRVAALDHVTLAVEKGTSFGLMGENGAGKSTLVKLIMGFISPTSGELRVLGEREVTRAHARIGYVHERPLFEPRFTGRSYLTYLGNLAGLWDTAIQQRCASVLAQVGLEEAADRPTRTYSKGMLQRLAIAQALLTDPDLLILDEPTSGLDPRSQWEVRQIITALLRQNKTILLCSHYLPEVEALCDTVAILQHGQLILHGAVGDLLRGHDLVEVVLETEEDTSEIIAHLNLAPVIVGAQDHELRIRASDQQLVLAALVQAQIGIASLNPLQRTLEDVYVQLTRSREAEGAGSEPGGRS